MKNTKSGRNSIMVSDVALHFPKFFSSVLHNLQKWLFIRVERTVTPRSTWRGC